MLVLYEHGRRGSAALCEAATLMRERAAEITVVTLAQQDTDAARCVVYTAAYNDGIRATAAAELNEARRLLGALAQQAHYELLVDGRDPSFDMRAATGGFDLVLLPARRLVHGRRRALERRLRRLIGVEVRAIAPGPRSRMAL